jgi:hypothetical protein
VRVGVNDCDADRVADWLAETDAVDEPEELLLVMLEVCDTLGVGDSESVCVSLGVGDCEGVGTCDLDWLSVVACVLDPLSTWLVDCV